MYDCPCCGQPVHKSVETSGRVVIVPLCDGCGMDDCNPSDTWHCDGRYGHSCDGTGCDAYRSERDTEMVAWLADAIRRNVGS